MQTKINFLKLGLGVIVLIGGVVYFYLAETLPLK